MDSLNSQQQAVVRCESSHILVLAGAGTGKTSTCASWVAANLQKGVPASSFLLITFTRRAGTELRERVESIAGRELPDLDAGTFHSIGIKILREYISRIDADAHTLIDERDSFSLYRRAAKEIGLLSTVDLRAMTSGISFARNTMTALDRIFPQPENADRAKNLFSCYTSFKAESRLWDYDDLLAGWLQAMRQDPAFVSSLRKQYSHVLVDEVQDNNHLNYAIVRALNPQRLLCVGDKWQSIYGFRGSQPQLIDSFRRDFAGAAVLTLSRNYRSDSSIIDCANRVTQSGRDAVRLEAASSAKGYLQAVRPSDADHEASEIVNYACALIERGAPPCEVAVLARTGRQLAATRKALEQAGLAFTAYGSGQGSHGADHAEIRDYSSLLRAVINPFDYMGRGAAIRILSGARRGDRSRKPLDRAVSAAAAGEIARLKSFRGSPDFFQRILDTVSPFILKRYPDGADRVSRLARSVALLEGQSPHQALDYLLTHSADDVAHPRDHLVVSTIHSAKGLEWDHVILAAVGARQLPHPFAQTKRAMEEERRLLYVAVTRARKSLVLSAPLSVNGFRQETSPLMPPLSWEVLPTPLRNTQRLDKTPAFSPARIPGRSR